MKIAVVGPAAGRETLHILLARYAESICAEAEITAADDLDSLPAFSWRLALIFVTEDGKESYHSFLAANPDCEIVLWAADDHLALPTLRSHPRDFLLLPVSEEQFLGVMKKCQSWADALRVIACSASGGGRRIRCCEIRYIESVGHSCTVYCHDEVFTVSQGLAPLQQQLGAGFLRCHRGFVVNMRCVAEIREKSLLLYGGAEIPLSPSQAANLSAEIGTYIQQYACFIRGGFTI